MMTLMGFSFCSWTRIQFSSDRPPQVESALAGDRAAGGAGLLPVHVVQGVDEAEVSER